MAPLLRIQWSAALVSRPPENAMPTFSPMGRRWRIVLTTRSVSHEGLRHSMSVMSAVPSAELRAQFGDIDIYLFDQLLRGRFDVRRRIIDAGCGVGGNLPYFAARGFEIFAIDEDPAAVSAVRKMVAALAPRLPLDNIRQGALHVLPWS